MPSLYPGLNSLRRLPGSGFELDGETGGANDAVLLDSLQGQRQQELQERLFNEARTAGMPGGGTRPEAQALQGLIGSIQGQRESSPLGRAQAGDVLVEQANVKARQGGFGSAQEAGTYGREQEAQKLQMPLKIAQANVQGDIEKQKLANQGAIDRTNALQTGSQNFMQGLAGGRPVHSYTPSTGAVTFETPQRRPTSGGMNQQALQNLQKARDAEGKVTQGYFSTEGARARASQATQQALAAVLIQHPAGSHVKDLAQQVVSNPEYNQRSASEIIQAAVGDDGTPLDDMEANDLREVLSILRGRDF